MADKLMYIPLITKLPFCISHKWLERLDTQINKPTNQNSIKFHKVKKYFFLRNEGFFSRVDLSKKC